MRQVLNNQIDLGEEDISKVEINLKSRDDIPKLLLGLQSIYADLETREELFKILEQLQKNTSHKNGRPGMALWRIFVLAMLRLNLNCDYDRLQELANEHLTLRKILGISSINKMYFELKTIKNNIRLFTPEILEQINIIIVNFGHKVCDKKKRLHVKCDSFVLETNIHFPTDSALLYDAIRKTIKLSADLCQKYSVTGWRQSQNNIKKIKSICTRISRIKKGHPRKPEMILAKEEQLKKAYKKLIKNSNIFIDKSTFFMDLLRKKYLVDEKYFEAIEKFISYGNLLIKQIIKRVFENKIIPHDEKIFSVFEPYSEWICKGKAKAPFELGKRVTIVEDQYGFILHSKIMDKQTDDKVAVEVILKTKNDFPDLSSCSFDKGYYSKSNREALSEILNFVVLPKKGKLSKKDQEIEFSEEFIKYRK